MRHAVPTLRAAASAGDCGEPTAADTARYKLPPLKSLEDIPPGFNPENSCTWDLATSVRTVLAGFPYFPSFYRYTYIEV